MEVILLEKMGKLGNLGDTVKVKPGYGRNYLIPQGKAIPATQANLADFDIRRTTLEKADAELVATAQNRAQTLEGKEVVIFANAGDEGKLFGSVGTREIVEALAGAGAEIDKSEVRLPEGAIRQTGEYEVDVHLHADVNVTVKVSVQAQQAAE